MPKENETLSCADYEALANLRYRIRKFRQFSTTAAEKLGLPAQHHQALLAIKGLPPGKQMSIAMLAERLLITPASATELAQSLEKTGYVDIDVKMPRRHLLRLTRKAEDVLQRLTSAHLYEIREMAPDLMEALRVLRDRRKMEVIAWMQ